jgi:hypothetical protein
VNFFVGLVLSFFGLCTGISGRLGGKSFFQIFVENMSIDNLVDKPGVLSIIKVRYQIFKKSISALW